MQGLQCQVADRDRRAAELSQAVSERDEALAALRRQVKDMSVLAAALKKQGAQQVWESTWLGYGRVIGSQLRTAAILLTTSVCCQRRR